jgi:hypothetical protein
MPRTIQNDGFTFTALRKSAALLLVKQSRGRNDKGRSWDRPLMNVGLLT